MFECLMPPGGKIEDFMIVGQRGWQEREDLIIQCQSALEKFQVEQFK